MTGCHEPQAAAARVAIRSIHRTIVSLKIHSLYRLHYMAKLRIVAEYLSFLRENKKWWLLPIVVLLLLFGLLIVLTKGSALAPFIYTIF